MTQHGETGGRVNYLSGLPVIRATHSFAQSGT
jgi:hypothetical protein